MKKLPLVTVTVALASAALFGAQDSAGQGPVVHLPELVVTGVREYPPPEAWRYATSPGFEILSNAADRSTRRLLKGFVMFQQALAIVWPQPKRAPQTTTLILCGSKNRFAEFLPADPSLGHRGSVSLFLNKGAHSAIVVDLERTVLYGVNPSTEDATGMMGDTYVEHDKQLYQEYVRYLLQQSEPRLPAWFESGFSQIVMRMEFDKRWISFGKLEDRSQRGGGTTTWLGGVSASGLESLGFDAAEANPAGVTSSAAASFSGRGDFNSALARRALIPMDRFFASSREGAATDRSIWSNQAYAFVHMCLYGMGGKFRQPFGVFLQRLGKEPPSEELFRQVFRMSYRDMLFELRGYVEFTAYEHKLYKSKEDMIVAPPPLEIRDASPAEVGRIKGEALLLAGRPRPAQLALVAPYVRGDRDPALLAALGIYEREHGDTARARQFLEAAFSMKAKNPDACLELARLRFSEALAKPAAAGQLSEPQRVAAMAPLLLARGQPPFLPASYELAGEIWARSATAPAQADAAFLIEGAQLFPTRLKLVYQAGVIARDAGEIGAAHALADHGLKWTSEQKGRQYFEALKASLPPAPAVTPSKDPVPARDPKAKKTAR